MHDSRKIFLTDKEPRCIRAVYDKVSETEPLYNSKEYKTYDPDIKVGDLIVIPTGERLKMTVNEVVAVDTEVDLTTSSKIDWIIHTIDKEAYEAIQAEEDKFLSIIRAGEKRRAKEKMREDFLGGEEYTNAVQALTHTKTDGEPTVPGDPDDTSK